MREITYNNVILARIIPHNWTENLSFYSQDQEYIQVGTWNYNKGKELPAHEHNIVPRTSDKTQEVIYIKQGSILVRIYGSDKKLVEEITLKKGDTLIALNGGHGYTILEDSTQVLEIKNGPYPGAEKDRTRF